VVCTGASVIRHCGVTSESVSSSSEEHSSADSQRVTAAAAAASGGACSQLWHRRDDDEEDDEDLPQHVVNAKRRKVSNIASSLIVPRHLNNIVLSSVQRAGLELQSSLSTYVR